MQLTKIWILELKYVIWPTMIQSSHSLLKDQVTMNPTSHCQVDCFKTSYFAENHNKACLDRSNLCSEINFNDSSGAIVRMWELIENLEIGSMGKNFRKKNLFLTKNIQHITNNCFISFRVIKKTWKFWSMVGPFTFYPLHTFVNLYFALEYLRSMFYE